VPIKSLFDHLKLGYNVDQFLEAFPTVARAQVEQLLDQTLRGQAPAPQTPPVSP
jgi:uncharacterized protein (DUF433 family)